MAILTLLPAGKKIVLPRQMTLAAALRRAGFSIGQHCSHDAHCTACRCLVIDGQANVDYGEFTGELQDLLATENVVLACLARARGDVIIEADLKPLPRPLQVIKRAATAPGPMEVSPPATATAPQWYRFWEKDSSTLAPRQVRGGGRRARFFKYSPTSEGAFPKKG
jgi:ferredoxin